MITGFIFVLMYALMGFKASDINQDFIPILYAIFIASDLNIIFCNNFSVKQEVK